MYQRGTEARDRPRYWPQGQAAASAGAIDPFQELARCPEPEDLLCRDRHRHTVFRVSADARVPGSGEEASKSPELHPVTTPQCLLDFLQDRINGSFDCLRREMRAGFRNLPDKLGAYHDVFLQPTVHISRAWYGLASQIFVVGHQRRESPDRTAKRADMICSRVSRTWMIC